MKGENKAVIVVFGSSLSNEGDESYKEAQELGKLLAMDGYVVCTGGYDGLMEALPRGAMEAGGETLGVTTEELKSYEPNPWLSKRIHTLNISQRMEKFIEVAHAFMALRGGIGTMAEVCFIWNLFQIGAIRMRPFILVGNHWSRCMEFFKNNLIVKERDFSYVTDVNSIQEALKELRKCV